MMNMVNNIEKNKQPNPTIPNSNNIFPTSCHNPYVNGPKQQIQDKEHPYIFTIL